ncbi:hypothetical protein SARC_05683 [Sphaeroforma arctica JP610]|uniref:Uncharacterized protein n=1 Tax=Sphaeroforma arctica JP610 TaxID=667725 RepID=A0A0L0G1E2_9EUKA|nr:hypothetical protein SARC_05683 [Sphaeroforma arctica JP610]KNC82023.1 hypothetical protein SARC_05683 [Sphaeroforma arctica JP610]|eukprot:XP_014155925.1 hypothetical protein SARC_05683 [Sphaeroforma arctica JP610]
MGESVANGSPEIALTLKRTNGLTRIRHASMYVYTHAIVNERSPSLLLQMMMSRGAKGSVSVGPTRTQPPKVHTHNQINASANDNTCRATQGTQSTHALPNKQNKQCCDGIMLH